MAAQKAVPALKPIVQRHTDIVARLLLFQRAYVLFQRRVTQIVEFPFGELTRTIALIDELIPLAYEAMDIPFDFIVDLRGAQKELRKLRVLKSMINSQARNSEAVVDQFITGPRSRKAYKVQWGDTLRGIAQRFLHDQTRWMELATLNSLDYPYIVFQASDIPAGQTVLKAGDIMSLPLDAQTEGNDVIGEVPTDLDTILGTDILLGNGMLQFDEAGDFTTISGVPNLIQATRHRLITDRGSLILHPEYGSDLNRFIGSEGNDTNAAMAALEAWSTLRNEPRFTRIQDVKARFEASVLEIPFTAFVISSDAPLSENIIIAR